MPFLLFIVFLLSPAELLAQEPLQVVTSIKPLQLITNQIMQGAGSADTLIDSAQSPHHFQLKPSQLKRAASTDLLIWVSNEFEAGLQRLQSVLPASSHQLELAGALPHSSLIGEDHAIDGHIWLSAENVILISGLIAQKLAEIDPLKQKLYRNNAQQLISSLTLWKQQNQQKLRSIKPSYILDHQFLAYFERSFGLHNEGSLRNTHDHGSSIKQLSSLHRQLQDRPPKCLLVTGLPLNPQAKQISQRYRLKVKLVDTLGTANSHKNIIDLLDSIVVTLTDCV